VLTQESDSLPIRAEEILHIHRHGQRDPYFLYFCPNRFKAILGRVKDSDTSLFHQQGHLDGYETYRYVIPVRSAHIGDVNLSRCTSLQIAQHHRVILSPQIYRSASNRETEPADTHSDREFGRRIGQTV